MQLILQSEQALIFELFALKVASAIGKIGVFSAASLELTGPGWQLRTVVETFVVICK
jgi:hypothetical protein